MRDTEIKEVLRKLDTLVRLFAFSLTAGKTQRDKIALLYQAGLPPKEIASMVGTTANTVSVEIATLRKAGRLTGRFKQEAKHEGK